MDLCSLLKTLLFASLVRLPIRQWWRVGTPILYAWQLCLALVNAKLVYINSTLNACTEYNTHTPYMLIQVWEILVQQCIDFLEHKDMVFLTYIGLINALTKYAWNLTGLQLLLLIGSVERFALFLYSTRYLLVGQLSVCR